MTRQHFQALAETTAEILDDLTPTANGGRGMGSLTMGQQDVIAEEIATALSDFCASQNPRFDRQRFAQAIGAKHQRIQCERNV